MSELLDKISSYNIFNYLLPGTLFVVIGDALTSYSLIYEDIFIAVFYYYFIGLVISRLGSLLIEPFFRLTKFVKYAEYGDYLSAAKHDTKIEELSETNNMYRTLSALFFALLLVVIFEKCIVQLHPSLATFLPYILLLFFVGIFPFAYRKQTKYIVDRISKHKKG